MHSPFEMCILANIKMLIIIIIVDTVCPTSSDPLHIVIYYIKWVTTSWTHSTTSSIFFKNIFVYMSEDVKSTQYMQTTKMHGVSRK